VVNLNSVCASTTHTLVTVALKRGASGRLPISMVWGSSAPTPEVAFLATMLQALENPTALLSTRLSFFTCVCVNNLPANQALNGDPMRRTPSASEIALLGTVLACDAATGNVKSAPAYNTSLLCSVLWIRRDCGPRYSLIPGRLFGVSLPTLRRAEYPCSESPSYWASTVLAGVRSGSHADSIVTQVCLSPLYCKMACQRISQEMAKSIRAANPVCKAKAKIEAADDSQMELFDSQQTPG
jgi:hypothetical protein